ncbi:hypothetical protein BG011_003793 [Mortierella polycephala]|uniref:Uncharacterized protein n=1 Tax=Mortierella polycephala TaxID=41804 RepID=A0A9P6Q3I2_9FUNG|nr:hypothetical protein BG011_003793 [Mortierella polycephala]
MIKPEVELESELFEDYLTQSSDSLLLEGMPMINGVVQMVEWIAAGLYSLQMAVWMFFSEDFEASLTFVFGTSTTMAASGVTGENEAALTSWRSPPWQPVYPPLAVSPGWSRPESPTLGVWDQQRQQLLSTTPANMRNGIATPEDTTQTMRRDI